MNTEVKTSDAKIAATRAFVRALNILLKFARLYGFDHARTAAQFQSTWKELQAAVSFETQTGLLLGAHGSQLLLDGVPLELGPSERSFAQLLSGAGVASVYFSPQVTEEELARLGRAFPSGGAKAIALAEQLKAALEGVSGIRINEIRFVAEDAGLADAKASAQLAAGAQGADTERLKTWLNDPQKLLQLITAAEASAEVGPGEPGVTGALEASGARAGGHEQVTLSILRLLGRLGQMASPPPASSSSLQEQLSKLPERAQETLQKALAVVAAQPPESQPGERALLKLAENLAIQCALDRYERGEVRVNGVREMLDRMSQEIESLRKIIGAHERKMARAGMLVESHADILDRQFWAAVPESGKRSVLLSPEAWCIPPRNVRQYVEELLGRGEQQTAQQILLQYSSCIHSEEPEGRRRTALGLAALAELYGSSNGSELATAIRQVGAQLSVEHDSALQELESAAFVRLTQEAAARRRYAALQQTFESLDSMENQRPAFAQTLRPRIAVESRLPEFIEEALRANRIPDGLDNVLRLMPRAAIEQLTARLNRCGSRGHCDRLVELAQKLGPEGAASLREQLRIGPAPEAAETVGMLSRLDLALVEQVLIQRVREFQRTGHDRMVRLLACCGAPERARLLLAVLEKLDPLAMPLALEEIGMTGDACVTPHLLRLAQGELPEFAGAYVRLKAIEALGRLRAHTAVPVLRQVAEAKQVWRWAHPSELRLAALEALEKIDPAWARDFFPRSGLSKAEMHPWLAPLDPAADSRSCRQRRYKRIRLARPLAAVTTNLRDSCRLEIKSLSFSGGLAGFDRQLAPGTLMTLKLGAALRGIRAQAVVRDARAHGLGFEFLDIELEERARLRHLLAGEPSLSAIPSAPSDKPPAE